MVGQMGIQKSVFLVSECIIPEQSLLWKLQLRKGNSNFVTFIISKMFENEVCARHTIATDNKKLEQSTAKLQCFVFFQYSTSDYFWTYSIWKCWQSFLKFRIMVTLYLFKALHTGTAALVTVVEIIANIRC